MAGRVVAGFPVRIQRSDVRGQNALFAPSDEGAGEPNAMRRDWGERKNKKSHQTCLSLRLGGKAADPPPSSEGGKVSSDFWFHRSRHVCPCRTGYGRARSPAPTAVWIYFHHSWDVCPRRTKRRQAWKPATTRSGFCPISPSVTRCARATSLVRGRKEYI